MLILWSIKDKWELNSLTPSKEVDRVLFGYSNYLSFWGTRLTGGIQAEMLTGCPGAGRDGGQNNPLLQLTHREKAFFAMLPLWSCGDRGSTKTPLAQLSWRSLGSRPGLKCWQILIQSSSHTLLTHRTTNPRPQGLGEEGVECTGGPFSDSTLLARSLTQHHVSDPLSVNCPHHYVSRTEPTVTENCHGVINIFTWLSTCTRQAAILRTWRFLFKPTVLE